MPPALAPGFYSTSSATAIEKLCLSSSDFRKRPSPDSWSKTWGKDQYLNPSRRPGGGCELPGPGPPAPGNGLSLLRLGALSLPQKMGCFLGKKGQGSEINRCGWASSLEEGQKRTEQLREEGKEPWAEGEERPFRWLPFGALAVRCQSLEHCYEKTRI